MSAESDELFRKVGEAVLAKMPKVTCFVNTIKAGDYILIPADKDIPDIGRAALEALMDINDFGECDACKLAWLDHADCPHCVLEWERMAPFRHGGDHIRPGPDCPMYEAKP